MAPSAEVKEVKDLCFMTFPPASHFFFFGPYVGGGSFYSVGTFGCYQPAPV